MKKAALGTFFLAVLFITSVYGQTAVYNVSGKVINGSTGAPLAQVTVSFQSTTLKVLINPVVTGTDGSYSIKLNAGDYYVTVNHKDFASYTQKSIKITSDTSFDFTLKVLQPPALAKSIKFHVFKTDPSGAKTDVANAKITLYGPTANNYEGTTDVNGVFILAEAPQGTYKAMVSDGTVTTYTAVSIKSDGPTFEIELKAPIPAPQGIVKGKVVNSANSNPLQGATVWAIYAGTAPTDPKSGKVPYFSTVTNANGEYTLSVLPGDYYVACSYYGGVKTFAAIIKYYDNVKTLAEAKIISVLKDAVAADINFGMDVPVNESATLTISGKLTSPLGKAVTDAKLVIYDRTNNTQTGASIKTDAEGKYQAAVTLRKGQHELVIGAYSGKFQAQFYNGKSSLNEADLIKIDITGDRASLENIDFTLAGYPKPETYSISGIVTDEENNPVAGVNVELTGNFKKTIMAYTDSTGSYKISGLPAGKYIAGFFAKGYVPQYYKDALTWEKAAPVEINSDVTEINAVIKKASMNLKSGLTQGKVSGKVTDMNGMLVSGARILLMGQDGSMIDADMSDSEGGYYLFGVPAGTYKMIASRVNYQSIETEINLVPDNSGESTYNINIGTSTTGINDLNGNLNPSKYVLENNYPNPFNPSTKIRFALAEQGHVMIEVYSLLGQKITTLLDGNMSAGYHEVSFNAAGLSSGIYIYKMSTLNFTESKLMNLMK